MKKLLISTLILLVISSSSAFAQSNQEKEWKMKQYFMVFLKTGPTRNHDSITAARIQQGHLENITRLFNEKKLILAGPFLDDTDLRGIFIFDVVSAAEVENLLKTDPAISSGRLSYEVHPWYGPGNIIIKKE